MLTKPCDSCYTCARTHAHTLTHNDAPWHRHPVGRHSQHSHRTHSTLPRLPTGYVHTYYVHPFSLLGYAVVDKELDSFPAVESSVGLVRRLLRLLPKPPRSQKQYWRENQWHCDEKYVHITYRTQYSYHPAPRCAARRSLPYARGCRARNIDGTDDADTDHAIIITCRLIERVGTLVVLRKSRFQENRT